MTSVAILGAGSIGHALVALLGSQADCDLRMWSRRAHATRRMQITLFHQRRAARCGSAIVSLNLEDVVEGADVVILAVPTHVRPQVLQAVSGYLGSCKLILSWEGTGPFDQILDRLGIHAPIAVGMQRSPIVCRLSEYGTSVDLLGVRSSVVAAATRPADSKVARDLLLALMPLPLVFSPRYLPVSLSSGNPLFHPARLYAHWCRHGSRCHSRERFYADWNDDASEILLALDAELAEIRRLLNVPARYVRTVSENMGTAVPAIVTRLVRSQASLRAILMPVSVRNGAPTLDYTHRFFQEDIGVGLEHLVSIGRRHGIQMRLGHDICSWFALGLCQATYAAT